MRALHVIGVDIGSVAIALAVLNDKREIVSSSYRFHRGAIAETLRSVLSGIDPKRIGGIAMTLSGSGVLRNVSRYDTQIATIAAVKNRHEKVGSTLLIGDEEFALATFDECGDDEQQKSDSPCAAGMGSLLDRQVKRLNLKRIDTLSLAAFCNRDPSPQTAARCAVFTKTDLIRARQEGFSVGPLGDGMCQALAENVLDTLVPDRNIRTPFILAGGVSLNQAVLTPFRRLLKTEPVIGDHHRLYGAIGAALLYLEEKSPETMPVKDWDELFVDEPKDKPYGYPPLRLTLSEYPDFSNNERYFFKSAGDVSDVEVVLYEPLKEEERVFLGIDIGSAGTKAVMIDHQNKVLISFHTDTAGRPLRAVQALFAAIDDLGLKYGSIFHFNGVATTGSGRKFIGRIIRADLMIDEIRAQARAAYELNHEADTVIEIGAQDATFATMNNGMVIFSAMNHGCAAGMGSFIEEQAQKLGVSLAEYALRAIDAPSPATSGCCTVFMERDINRCLIEGYSVDEVLAGILHAVSENYLDRVAGEANIGEKICFQGATARNKALVAALEYRLNKPIFVSPFCHLTGALGSALILAENHAKLSAFRGLSLHRESIPIENEVCDLCHNNCKIRKVTVQGETVTFGFICRMD